MEKFRLTPSLIRNVEALGLNWEKLKLKYEIDQQLADEGLPSIPAYKMGLLVHEMSIASGDPSFAVKAMSSLKAEDMGVLGLSFIHSENAVAAIEKFARYKFILGPELIELIYGQDIAKVRFSYVCDEFEHSGPILHGGMAFIANKLLERTGGKCRIKRVVLRDKEISDFKSYTHYFGMPPELGGKENFLELSRQDLIMPFLHSDIMLSKIMSGHAQDILAKMQSEISLSAKVEYTLFSMLDGSSLSIEKVAKKLGLSKRALQAQLQDEGKMFRQLLENTRKQSAFKLLDNEELEISEVAYLLGYSSSNAFTRAFKEWSGKTPDQFRRRNRFLIS